MHIDNNGLLTAVTPIVAAAPPTGNLNEFAYFSGANTVSGTNMLKMVSGTKLEVKAGVGIGMGKVPTVTLDIRGDIQATGDVIGFATSDERVKDKIDDLSNALDKVNTLSTFTYAHNEKAVEIGAAEKNDHRVRVGLSAQEVQKVLPEAVMTASFDRDSSGKSISGENYLSIDYSRIVPLLVAAVQELAQKIEE